MQYEIKDIKAPRLTQEYARQHRLYSGCWPKESPRNTGRFISHVPISSEMEDDVEYLEALANERPVKLLLAQLMPLMADGRAYTLKLHGWFVWESVPEASWMQGYSASVFATADLILADYNDAQLREYAALPLEAMEKMGLIIDSRDGAIIVETRPDSEGWVERRAFLKDYIGWKRVELIEEAEN
jgi:hypothetical protein